MNKSNKDCDGDAMMDKQMEKMGKEKPAGKKPAKKKAASKSKGKK